MSFEREARAISSLNHPHICALYDVGEASVPEPMRFLVMELYDLDLDPREEHEVAGANPDVVDRIERYLQTARTESERWPAK